jgi:hypothetical protein
MLFTNILKTLKITFIENFQPLVNTISSGQDFSTLGSLLMKDIIITF